MNLPQNDMDICEILSQCSLMPTDTGTTTIIVTPTGVYTEQASILSLPDEILQTIFDFVPDHTIFAITLVCRRFYNLSSLPISWRARCEHYTFWEPHHSFHQKLRHPNPSEIQWRKLFAKRWTCDRKVKGFLDEIIKYSTDRISRFEKIAREGYDAKDCLRRELDCGEQTEDVLARRFFASEALAFIHRKRAIEIWKRVADDLEVPLEEALGAYDLFVTRGANRDVEAISHSLDCLAADYRAQNPHYGSLDDLKLAEDIIWFMRGVGFQGATWNNFSLLVNSFIGICVDTNRATLPLTTVAVFCGLGGRLGLDVKACVVNFHVIAIVTTAESDPGDTITNKRQSFWDPYSTHLQIDPLKFGQDIADPMNPNLPTANIRELIVRVARNILESVRQTGAQPTPTFNNANGGGWGGPPYIPERHAALYAALTASVICGPPASTRLLEHMCTLMQRDFGMDVGFFENDMARLIGDDDAMLLHNICNAVRKEDATPKKPMLRYLRSATDAEGSSAALAAADTLATPESESEPTKSEDITDPSLAPLGYSVRYHIGTIFRHRRYGYEAVITGWTRNCATDENWICNMDVDKLKRGRHQPFYNVFVEDGSSRYVAEDNIEEIKPGDSGHPLCEFLVMGKWFRRFDQGEGKFTSNLGDEYPDG